MVVTFFFFTFDFFFSLKTILKDVIFDVSSKSPGNDFNENIWKSLRRQYKWSAVNNWIIIAYRKLGISYFDYSNLWQVFFINKTVLWFTYNLNQTIILKHIFKLYFSSEFLFFTQWWLRKVICFTNIDNDLL